MRSRFHATKPELTVLDQFGELIPIHRLDREVEGLLMAAKNKNAHRIGNAWFEKKEIKKSYWALASEVDLDVMGKLPFEVEKIDAKLNRSFVWKSKILRGKKRSYASPHGDVTETQAIIRGVSKTKTGQNIFQWELNPVTGKSHQLRFEMARHSQPILGDELYFAPITPRYPNGIALIAKKLDFSNCPGHQELGLPDIVELDLNWEAFLSLLTENVATKVAD